MVSAVFDWVTSRWCDTGLLTATGTWTLACRELASLEADWLVLFSLFADWVWSSFCPPSPPEGSPPRLTDTPVAAAPWFCWFCCSVLLWFAEDALFSALLDWFTSPLFDPGLLTATGTLTLVCSLSASLSADCEVELLFDPDWLCST